MGVAVETRPFRSGFYAVAYGAGKRAADDLDKLTANPPSAQVQVVDALEASSNAPTAEVELVASGPGAADAVAVAAS